MPSILLPKVVTTQKEIFTEHSIYIQKIVEATSTIEYKHDNITGCYRCDEIAGQCLLGLQWVKQQQTTFVCNASLLKLVQQSVGLVQQHTDMSRVQHLAWVPVLMNALRELGKRIKDESPESDRMVSLPLSIESESEEEQSHNSLSQWETSGHPYEDYGRAIRITIYYCRASLCEELDLAKSIHYYRKCMSVRPSPYESQRLQVSAKTALQHLIAESYPLKRPSLTSRTSSISSIATTSSCSMSCANCGVEKRAMPVCSRCKSQYYCSIKCLKIHKPVHQTNCQS
ncbi:hypothetical protein BD560DRAFT_398425 [Blakeslea trispora]|nr:hypothetical protein BD560DRAFT_398425 [Blakeslea trispora]